MPFIEKRLTLPIENHGRLLTACDALMHVHSMEGTVFIGRFLMNWREPIWCKTSEKILGKDKVAAWFGHMDSMRWDSVVCGHGEPVIDCDHGWMQNWLLCIL